MRRCVHTVARMTPPDLIEVYDDALPRDACAALVERFEASGAAQPGRIGSGVYRDLKDSADITISVKPEWRDAEVALNQAVFFGLAKYLRTYPHALIAPLGIEVQDPQDATRRLRLDEASLRALPDAQLFGVLRYAFRPGSINLQRYRAGQGGYPYWHCELFPKNPDADQLHRHVLWTIYLNDGFTQGETEFLYQQRKIVPRVGSLLIAPTAFTHTHRGNTPQGSDKYIATSWVLFQRAEALFPAG
jgi:hypothetical protein